MNVKQVVVVHTDVNMRQGKLAAQVAHASLPVFVDRGVIVDGELRVPLTAEMKEWLRGIYAKIVLGVGTEADLVRVHELALASGIPSALVTDLGLTELNGIATRTACAIGPADAGEIVKITGPAGAKTKLL